MKDIQQTAWKQYGKYKERIAENETVKRNNQSENWNIKKIKQNTGTTSTRQRKGNQKINSYNWERKRKIRTYEFTSYETPSWKQKNKKKTIIKN